jgi:hypothetical protein
LTTIELFFESDDMQNDLTLEFEVDYTPPTESKFNSNFGNYLPGEQAQVKIGDVILNGEKLEKQIREFFVKKYEDTVQERLLKGLENE